MFFDVVKNAPMWDRFIEIPLSLSVSFTFNVAVYPCCTVEAKNSILFVDFNQFIFNAQIRCRGSYCFANYFGFYRTLTPTMILNWPIFVIFQGSIVLLRVILLPLTVFSSYTTQKNTTNSRVFRCCGSNYDIFSWTKLFRRTPELPVLCFWSDCCSSYHDANFW